MVKSLKKDQWGLDKFDVLVLIALLFLSFIPRLMLIMEPNAILNGDECIQGLMAKHLLEGTDQSLYFYGQAYGFSFIENVFIAMAYKLNGFGENSLKLGLFFLWYLGLTFFYLFIRSLAQKRFRWLMLILILILALSPAWISFSTQARAGYVSAFSLSSFSLFLWQTSNRGNLFLIFQALILVLIYESQALWLPPLIPFLIYKLWPLKSVKKWFLFALSSLVIFNLFAFYKTSLNDFWSPQIFAFTRETFNHNFQLVGSKLFQNLSGLYYLEVDREIPLLMKPYLFFYMGLLFISMLYGFFRIIMRKENYRLDLVFISSTLMVLIVSLFLKSFSTRYLLPFMGFSLLPILHFLVLQKKLVHFSVALVLLGLLFLVPPNYSKAYYHPEERAHLDENLEAFDSLKISNAFILDPMMQWQIIYYSNEEIKCRFKSKVDRFPLYSEAVNRAFRKGEDYALFGRSYRIKKPFSADHQTVDGGYSFVLKPNRRILKSNGFILAKD